MHILGKHLSKNVAEIQLLTSTNNLQGTSQDYIYACQKACRYNDSRLREIFLVKCQKQAFSFNKREAKVYCYAFLHVLKRDTCIKHE
jgi:hypothetical protein